MARLSRERLSGSSPFCFRGFPLRRHSGGARPACGEANNHVVIGKRDVYQHDDDFRQVRLNQPHPATVIPSVHGDLEINPFAAMKLS
jgi:hypothetical protein